MSKPYKIGDQIGVDCVIVGGTVVRVPGQISEVYETADGYEYRIEISPPKRSEYGLLPRFVWRDESEIYNLQ